ncbi:kinesin motor domain containing protein [Nannochloropsis gaditana]|uniref:Kinesin-like protein n=2 Tax=Nannochloropsis gaditana TaxID=72520 RepID=W7UCQ1_9STRA|nr:kinesin motor domain containing protein [Nannochloropsis gaditana]
MPTPSRFQGTPSRLASSSSNVSTVSTPRTPNVTTPSRRTTLSSVSGARQQQHVSTLTGGSSAGKRDTCLEEIQRLQQKRTERRRSMEEKRAERAKHEKRLQDQGMPGDVDFQLMIGAFRTEYGLEPHPHIPPGDLKICICVRKRPINAKERKRKDYDAVTCFNPVVMVHDCRLRVDGITKYLDNTDFAFDHTFDEEDSTEALYRYTAKPLVPFVFRQGRATCFAYGQTGSGKTFTMCGIQQQVVVDVFAHLSQAHATQQAPGGLGVYVSYFEIYGGRCQDLLNHRHKLLVREDGKGDVVIGELSEKEASSEEELWRLIEEGNRNRTTHATEVNDVSSRSHAICQVLLRDQDSGKLWGKLSLVDLAGSERGADTKSHCRQRRLESAEINKSLLALKECIRALDAGGGTHVPYRASKLTLVLKDCFTKEKARTVMIATVSPNASSADHTLNTLRYADRVKQKKAEDFHNSGSGSSVGKGLRTEGCGEGRAVRGTGLGGDFEDEEREGRGGEEGASGDREDEFEDEGEDGMEGTEQSSPETPMKRAVLASFSSPPATASPLPPSSSSKLRRTPLRTGMGPPVRLAPSTALKAARGAHHGGVEGSHTTSHHGSSLSSGNTVAVAPVSATERTPGRLSQPHQPGDTGRGLQNANISSREVLPPPGGERDKDKAPVSRKIPSQGDDSSGGEASQAEAESLDDPDLESLYDEEDALLNLHMNVIQENAELLTEEGSLLQQIQGDGVQDYDLDTYTQRLEEILARKMDLIGDLREKVGEFRARLQQEENAGRVRGEGMEG